VDPLEIVPATAEVWPALEDLFARRGGGDARFCWCRWWRVRAKDFAASPPARNRDALRDLVAAGPPPGLVALHDGRAVGWVGLGPRSGYERLERSRVIPRPADPPPWAVVCFVVAADARGRGVASALLEAAVEHADAAGAPAVEGYPIDLAAGSATRVPETSAFVGTRSMFERAGFRRVANTASHSGGAPRVVMRRELP
jgi:GNAT superfamily N-acetyltransferase